MEDVKPEEKVTSADIKKQIEEAKRASKTTELRDSGLPLTGQVANEINANPMSITEKTVEAASNPQPAKADEKKTTDSVDLKEWAKTKGVTWTTEESVLSALRRSDQEFHKRQAEKKAKESAMNPIPMPQYEPPPMMRPEPNIVPFPQQNPQVVHEIARLYNMTPDDVERLSRFNRDFFQALAKDMFEQGQKQQREELERLKLENQKNSVFRELSSDPVFRRPDVGLEYQKVLEEMQGSEPQSFENDPNVYKRAYDRTLVNIARRNLEGHELIEGQPPKATAIVPPTTPPRPLGRGSGGGAEERESDTIDPEQFRKLSVEEKRRVLQRAGLVSQY